MMDRLPVVSCLLLACLLFFLPTTSSKAQDSPTLLTPYSTQTIRLDAATPLLTFPFEAEAESVWSFSVVSIPLTGNLDPVLRLLDSDGEVMAQNDNQTRQSSDARLENWIAPEDGDYTLEISRVGQTLGEATLTITGDPDSIPLSPLPIREEVTLAAGQVMDLARLDNRHYQRVQLRFGLTLSGADGFGLQLRSGNGTGQGDWLLVVGRAGITLQETALDAEGALFEKVITDLDQRLEVGQYEVELDQSQLRLRINGEDAITLHSDDLNQFVFLRPTYQSLRLVAMPNNVNSLTITTPYASTAFYTDLIPLSQALPPAPPEGRLFAYGDVPLNVIRELRTANFIGEGGGLTFSIAEGLLETSEVGFNTYPLGMADGLQDVVIGFWVLLRNGDPTTACGLNIRQSDSANFSAALISGDGNAYLLPYEDGELSASNLAVSTPWITPTMGQENHVLLVAIDEQLTLFVNGYWVGETTIPAQAGGLWLEMVVNQPTIARCFYRNLWVWGLE